MDVRPRGLSRHRCTVQTAGRGNGPGEAQALLHQIQQLMHERVMFAPIWLYFWPSGIGPRVEEPALMLINPFPWSAPLEDVRLKQG